MRRPQAGRFAPITAPEIAAVRRTWAALVAARLDADRIRARLNLSADQFREIGNGTRGKKPRPEA